MYRKPRRDANERQLIQIAQALGASVVQLDDPHVPDLLIGFLGANVLAEVKTEKGKLTSGQTVFMGSWQGQATIVRSTEDIIKLLARTAAQRMSALPSSLIVKAFQCWIVILS